MAQTLVAQAAPIETRARSNWLYGGAVDLLLGAGLAYLLTIPLLVWWSSRYGLSEWSVGLTFALALLVSGPHYGATLVRVYEHAADRRRYEIFAVYVTLGVIALFGWGLRDAWVGSLLVTAYVTWSPWHFAGQNYGIALMFLRRRGVEVTPVAKRLLYMSFVLSFLLAMLAIHRAGGNLVFAQGVEYQGGYRLLRAGIPSSIVLWLGVVLVPVYVLCMVAAAALLLRRGAALRDLGAPALVALTQSLWFALPAAGALTGAWNLTGLAFAPIWISTGHAVQYLWVTSYYAGRSSPSVPSVPFLAKALLAGAVLILLPQLLLSPNLVGGYLTVQGVGTLLFAAVNLHHFLLDGAIWKLRDGRVASVLLRSAPEEVAPVDPLERGWLRRCIWVVGAACLAGVGWVAFSEWAARSPGVSLAVAERANWTLAWFERDHPALWIDLAARYERGGRVAPAIDALRRAVDGVERDLEELPSTELTNRLAYLLLIHRRSDSESVAEAIRLARYAVGVKPEDATARRLLAMAEAASVRLQRASR